MRVLFVYKEKNGDNLFVPVIRTRLSVHGIEAISSVDEFWNPPLCGSFHPNSVAVARYGALIRAKSPTNCDAHLAESLFQTRSRTKTGANTFCLFLARKRTLSDWLKASYQTRLYVFQERNSFFYFILFVIFMFFKEILCFLYDYTA